MNRYAPFVKRYPITSLVAGFGAGFSLGVLAAAVFRRQEPAPWFQRLSPASLHDLSEALRNLPAKAAGYIPDPAGWR